MGRMGKRPFLFHSNLDVQGPLCVTEDDVFISFCLLVHVNICFPSPPAPSALVVWSALKKGHCRVFSLSPLRDRPVSTQWLIISLSL